MEIELAYRNSIPLDGTAMTPEELQKWREAGQRERDERDQQRLQLSDDILRLVQNHPFVNCVYQHAVRNNWTREQFLEKCVLVLAEAHQGVIQRRLEDLQRIPGGLIGKEATC